MDPSPDPRPPRESPPSADPSIPAPLHPLTNPLRSGGPVDRRTFLHWMTWGGASFLGLPASAFGAAKPVGSSVHWSRLKFRARGGDEDDWNVHPHGDMNLIDHIAGTTTIHLHRTWRVASVHNLDSMIEYPFLFMHAELPPEFDDADRQNLREYLLRGGFLFAEDCVIGKMNLGPNMRNDLFFRTVLDEMPRVLPEAKVQKLPFDHPIFHCFYHFDRGSPHMQGTPHGGYGVFLDGRMVSYLSPSDLHCGWTNGDDWFGAGKSAAAMRMGANIYVYAMTQGI